MIKLVAAAAGLLAVWAAPGQSATWCGTPASSDREPQVAAGHNVHAVYAIASDGPDNTGAVAQAMQTDAETIDAWWRVQDAARSLRFDLFPYACGPQLDLSVVRVPASSAQLRLLDRRAERIEGALTAGGFDTQYVKYLVYYDGPVDATEEGEVCGQGFGRPSGEGIAIVYTQACAGVETASTAVHELVHALGAMSDAPTPHECPDSPGHACEAGDLLLPTAAEGEVLAQLTLDVGHDDYYGHSSVWFDVQDSQWLRRLDAQTRLSLQLTGAGSVESDVPGLACSVSCSAEWNPGTLVSLTATAAAGRRFVRWSGACSGSAHCVVRLDQAATVNALFAAQSFRLAVSRTGRGTVTSSGREIVCPTRCASALTSYTPLRLSAKPAKGWRFLGWSGGCAGTRPACTLPMTKASAARATFVRRR